MCCHVTPIALPPLAEPCLAVASLGVQAEGAAEGDGGLSVMEKYGLQYVRGCEVIEIRDEGGCTTSPQQPARPAMPCCGSPPCWRHHC